MHAPTDLLESATLARTRAYAPYSGYAVGAAVRDEKGRIWTGCNVENISYGLTVCAERAAVCRMVAEEGRKIQEIAVATRDGGMPCGMCLQVLLEFADDPAAMSVYTSTPEGAVTVRTLAELIPHGFRSKQVGRTSETASEVKGG